MKARTPPSTEINVSLNICSKYFRKHPQHKCQHQISKRTNIFQIFQNIKFLKRPTFTREHLGTKDRSIFLPAPTWYHGHKNMMFFCIKTIDDRNWIYPSRIFLEAFRQQTPLNINELMYMLFINKHRNLATLLISLK